jgi:hypothetical protein
MLLILSQMAYRLVIGDSQQPGTQFCPSGVSRQGFVSGQKGFGCHIFSIIFIQTERPAEQKYRLLVFTDKFTERALITCAKPPQPTYFSLWMYITRQKTLLSSISRIRLLKSFNFFETFHAIAATNYMKSATIRQKE